MAIDPQRQREAEANHRASLANSLKRRMEAARARNNSQLLAALEREMNQLGLQP
ncbi:MAG: hypothetical protein ACUVSQ_06170 [Pseudanabaenaceae cyanobacterium]